MERCSGPISPRQSSRPLVIHIDLSKVLKRLRIMPYHLVG